MFAAVMVATGVMIVRALLLGQWSAAAIVGAFLRCSPISSANYFYRNRPGRYAPTRHSGRCLLPKG